MYILIISRGYPSNKYKVNGIFEFDQARALAEAGHKVVYAAIDMRSLRRWRKWGFESFVKDGVYVEAVNIPCGRIPKLLLNQISKIALQELYKKIYKKYGQPDIIHAHFINSGYLTAQVFCNSMIPLVLTEHFSGMNQQKISIDMQKMGNYTYKRMDKVIAVSRTLANNIEEKFNIESLVIPNVVDTNSFKYNDTKKNHDSFCFVSVGNLLPIKRMDLLIEAFYKAFSDNSKVKLYIYGDGIEIKNLKKLITNLKMEEQIYLMGLAGRTQIANQMLKSDCFVLASRSETFGVAYIEAMAMGLAVIATKCGGPEDFITEENGLLVPVDDKEKLSESLLYIYKNIDSYNRKKISDLAKAKFNFKEIANMLIKVYEDVLKSK